MSDPYLSPYLTFNGECEEAMNFYKNVLGGELEISRFGDFASADMPVADDQKDKVMHASLTSGPINIMASESMPDVKVVSGSNVSLSIAGTDSDLLTKYFNGLSEGGEVTMPLAKQVWGDTFGMFSDKYGMHWMINITAAK